MYAKNGRSHGRCLFYRAYAFKSLQGARQLLSSPTSMFPILNFWLYLPSIFPPPNILLNEIALYLFLDKRLLVAKILNI